MINYLKDNKLNSLNKSSKKKLPSKKKFPFKEKKFNGLKHCNRSDVKSKMSKKKKTIKKVDFEIEKVDVDDDNDVIMLCLLYFLEENFTYNRGTNT